MGHALYLLFNGTCEEAINFYKETLGGNISAMQRYGDVPDSAPEHLKDKIMHGVMELQNLIVMFSDANDKHSVQVGNNFSIALDFKSDGELRRAFDTLSTGGQVTMPVQDTFWGATFAMCTDRFGVNWMFNYDKPKS